MLNAYLYFDQDLSVGTSRSSKHHTDFKKVQCLIYHSKNAQELYLSCTCYCQPLVKDEMSFHYNDQHRVEGKAGVTRSDEQY